MTTVIGLDISKTRTGICFGPVGGDPKFLSLHGKDISDIAFGARLLGWLIDFCREETVSAIYIEAPIERISKGFGSIKTIIVLNALAFLVEVFAYMKSIPFERVHVATLRKAFLGDGGLRTAAAEERTRAMCRILGWAPANHDEADAGGVWWFACSTYSARDAHKIGKLLQEQAKSMSAKGMEQ